MIGKSKPSKRGGVRERIKNKSGASRLLEVLWNTLGGPVAVAETLNVHSSLIISWRIRGKVPIKLVPHVGKILNVPLYGLNYLDIIKFYNAKPWEDVVRSYKFNSDEIDWILKGRKPKDL